MKDSLHAIGIIKSVMVPAKTGRWAVQRDAEIVAILFVLAIYCVNGFVVTLKDLRR